MPVLFLLPYLAYTQHMKIDSARVLRQFACVAALLPLAASASTFYKCTDESGKVLFTNTRPSVGKAKCTTLSYYSSPSESAGANRKRSRAAATPTPGDFPRVAGNEQKDRDNDRRAIIEKELGVEQENLDKARKLLAASAPAQKPQAQRDTVALHERNIQALQKELGNLR